MIRANGYVFLCSIETQDECFERKLFGTSEEYKDRYVDIKVGDLIFLYNVEIGQLFGLYEAQSECRKILFPLLGMEDFLIKFQSNGKYTMIQSMQEMLGYTQSRSWMQY